MADLPPLPTPFTVVIDQREKLPFDFGDLWSDAKEGSLILAVSTKLGHLPSGDYSLEGCEAEIAIERKSLADLYSTIGQHRDRFEREIERLDRMTFALIVVEEDWRSILERPPERSRLKPKTVFRSIIAWSQRFPRVHWMPCTNRRLAEVLTFRHLERFWKDKQRKEKGKLSA